MTDRINALVVTLERDYREDDVEALVSAISMLKGVLSVKTNAASLHDHVAYERARYVMTKKLWAALSPEEEA